MMPVRALLRLVFKNVHQQLTINCFLINTDVRLKLSKHKKCKEQFTLRTNKERSTKSSWSKIFIHRWNKYLNKWKECYLGLYSSIEVTDYLTTTSKIQDSSLALHDQSLFSNETSSTHVPTQAGGSHLMLDVINVGSY